MPLPRVSTTRCISSALLLTVLTLTGPEHGYAQESEDSPIPAESQQTREAGNERMPSPPPARVNQARDNRALIFFPPTPPRLRAQIPPFSAESLRRPAPRELAPFINEPFYAPLGTRLSGDSLPVELEARIAAYHENKLARQRELLARYESVAQADPITRERTLSAFAQEQTPALIELEAEAEEIRRKLIRWRDDWNALRQWKLGQTGFPTSQMALNAQYQVLRAAAYYEKVLSPAQRRLVREVAMDLGSIDVTPVLPVDYTNDFNPLLSFLPETSRIFLPPQLPNELADMIAAFEAEKSTLKQQLRDAIYEEDKARLTLLKNHRLKQLADRQAPVFTHLEVRAEEIRKALATLPNQPTPPELPYLPPTLADRLIDYLEQRVTMRKDTVAMVRDLQDITPIERIAFTRNEEGQNVMRIMLSPGRRDEEALAAVNVRMADFTTNHERLQVKRAEELASIRENLLWLNGGTEDETAQRNVDRLIEEFTEAYNERRLWEQYREYHLAVLEPGLSPEQRRLIYDASLVKLDMPLPGGLLQPRQAPRRQNLQIGQAGTQTSPGANRSLNDNPSR